MSVLRREEEEKSMNLKFHSRGFTLRIWNKKRKKKQHEENCSRVSQQKALLSNTFQMMEMILWVVYRRV